MTLPLCTACRIVMHLAQCTEPRKAVAIAHVLGMSTPRVEMRLRLLANRKLVVKHPPPDGYRVGYTYSLVRTA